VSDQRRAVGSERLASEIEIDIGTAHPARVHNYLAGGDAHFAADRAAIDQAVAVLPGGLETARRAVQALAAFQDRVVRYLVAEVGIRQFLKLGSAVPAGEDVHEIAQAAAPGTRVVYVGHDPTVLAHAHALRRQCPEGVTAYVHGHVLKVEAIMREAATTLDLTRPVALLLPATLNFVPDQDDPHGVVARFVGAVPSGSYLALSHTSHEVGSERMQDAAERFGKVLVGPYVVRSRDEIARFLVGLDVLEPGLIPIERWRPATPTTIAAPPPEPEGRPVPIYGALARKP
jgi:hypothetical protein